MLAGGCAALILGACSGSDASAPTTTVVIWKDYEPGLQAKIDAMSLAKDCDGMQLEFNQIGGTNLVVTNKFGHSNEAVLGYIDAKERQANCFPDVVAVTTPTTG
jgi:hypothetical protein